jgi:hypothetical protein
MQVNDYETDDGLLHRFEAFLAVAEAFCRLKAVFQKASL